MKKKALLLAIHQALPDAHRVTLKSSETKPDHLVIEYSVTGCMRQGVDPHLFFGKFGSIEHKSMGHGLMKSSLSSVEINVDKIEQVLSSLNEITPFESVEILKNF